MQYKHCLIKNEPNSKVISVCSLLVSLVEKLVILNISYIGTVIKAYTLLFVYNVCNKLFINNDVSVVIKLLFQYNGMIIYYLLHYYSRVWAVGCPLAYLMLQLLNRLNTVVDTAHTNRLFRKLNFL